MSGKSKKIDMSRVVFTRHALDQFNARWLTMSGHLPLENPENTARELLSQAKLRPVKGLAFVRRFLNNGCVQVLCYCRSGWRFIVKEEGENLIVLTIEITREKSRELLRRAMKIFEDKGDAWPKGTWNDPAER